MVNFLQSNYKWWYILSFHFKRSLIYRAVYLAMVIRYLVPVAILLTVFFTSGNSKPVAYYLFATMVFYIFTLPMNISYEMKVGVLFGKYVRLLILPINLKLFMLFQSIGIMLVPFLIRLVIFAGLFWFFKVPLAWDLNAALGIFTAGVFGVLIGFVSELLIGVTSFVLPDNKFLLQAYQDIVELLAGGILPLVGPLGFLSYLPLSFAVFHPIQIYYGNYSFDQIVWVFVMGFTWFVGLYVLSNYLFRLGLKKFEGVGL